VNIKAILKLIAAILFWITALLLPVAMYLMSPGEPSSAGRSH